MLTAWRLLWTGGASDFSRLQLLAWLVKPYKWQLRANIELLNAKVLPYRRLLKRRNSPNSPAGCRIFLHIPKTAGTTLSHLIMRNHQPARVLLAHNSNIMTTPGLLTKAGNLPVAVSGHTRIDAMVYQALQSRKRFIHFTVLRHPVDRCVSYYHFVRRRPHHPSHKDLINLSLRQAVRKNRYGEFGNLQSRFLLGGKPPQNTDENYAMACEALTQRFSLVGIQEAFDGFVLMLHQLLHFNEIFIPPRNTNADKKPEISAEDRQLLENQNALDMRVYDFARALYYRRAQELGIDESAISRYRQLNQLHHENLQSQVSSLTSEGTT